MNTDNVLFAYGDTSNRYRPLRAVRKIISGAWMNALNTDNVLFPSAFIGAHRRLSVSSCPLMWSALTPQIPPAPPPSLSPRRNRSTPRQAPCLRGTSPPCPRPPAPPRRSPARYRAADRAPPASTALAISRFTLAVAAVQVLRRRRLHREIGGLQHPRFHLAVADLPGRRRTRGGDLVQAVGAVHHEAALQSQAPPARPPSAPRPGPTARRSTAPWRPPDSSADPAD